MNDIVARLRASVTQCRAVDRSQLLAEAADTIERLQLTDEEREHVTWAADNLDSCGFGSEELLKLLERLK